MHVSQESMGQALQLPGDLALPSCFQHIEADHGVVIHDDRVVALDEAHASHVCCKVEDMIHALADLFAVVEDSQID
jgi:hypothetical protein